MISGLKNITFRYTFIVVIMAVLAILIIVKAGIIMFAERQYWKDVADRFVKENVVIRPTRGNIISADGKLMASSLPEYKIYMDFRVQSSKQDTMLMNHLQEICNGLHEIFPDRSAQDFRKHILKGRRAKSRHFLLYPKRISYIQYKEVKKLPLFNQSKNISGLHEEVFNQRKKPFGSLAMRTLGDMFPDMAQGAKNGLELTYDSLLKGENGITHRQKVMNKYLNIVDKPAIDGYDVITTIDVDMQDIAEKALVDQLKNLDAVFGVAVVMDVATGEVKANVNMTKAGDGKYYEMRNLAVSNLMEPGSTFKTASIMVALEDKYITPDYKVDTKNGMVNMYGSWMKDWNWYKGGYGEIDVTRILEVSSNVGVSSIIDKFYGKDPQKFIDGLRRMSIDKPLNLGFVGEASPRIKGPKERYFAKTTLPWMSIGYETMIPPIYMLNFYNAIANNGVMVKPKFVKAIARNGEIVEEYPTEIVNPKICSDETLQQIQTILRKVVSEGLAKPAGSKQFSVSGKTGTAQISQGKAGYKANGVSYLVSFCGYFPSEAPKYSCIVSIQIPHGPASGGLQAGSVFSRIAERIYAKHLVKNIAQAKDSTAVLIPDVAQGDITETAYVLKQLNVKSNSASIPYSFNPVWGKAKTTDSYVELSTAQPDKKRVPNVVGMGAKDAVYLLESYGMKVHLSGVGKVHTQSIPSGSMVRKGEYITLTLKN
ncbi:penicillin-binding transpeptidase domain-containing protein [Phocaeicola sp. KGMB11183]|jgi:cell division protein FtsI (penicillin-binding protein 3)|uniref:Penicillin-binding transpeptidase domain-containing protein n=1 Tax=Phocaeicola acetigenes TaxID=3016083 RepID=A0ABT4PIF9_9BACT|nr:penicillin-binding transpeptidase domain-containing protein [Phocaeicola sp. KGMB11183]MCZ8372813.1 penicillin-binding transpeptidase domain-containing protein [Phocaeicola sp. KGMB11183]